MGFGEFYLTEMKVHKLRGYFHKKGGKYSVVGVGSNYGPSIDHKERNLKDLDNTKQVSQFIDETIEEMNSLPDGLYTIAMEYEFHAKYKKAQGWVKKFTKTTLEKEMKKLDKNDEKKSGGINIKDPGIKGRARDIERVSNMQKAASAKAMSLKFFLKKL